MNNLDVDRINLIDISLEDDFLIDKHFDNSSVDLRLSVAFESQKELVCDLKPRARARMNDRAQYIHDKEVQRFQQESENGDSVRQSLAWDNAFFTSPGFLELEELSLVNRGFKNSEGKFSCRNQDNIRSKICLERNSGQNAGIGAGHRQNSQSLLKAKVASLNKMTTSQDANRHQLTATRRSDALPGASAKSQVVQSTTNRPGYLKSAKKGQMRFSAVQIKRSPLQAGSKNVKNRPPERLHIGVRKLGKSRDTNFVSSSQSVVPSTLANNSIDFSRYTSTDYDDTWTSDVTNSTDLEGEGALRSCTTTPIKSPKPAVQDVSPHGFTANNATQTPNLGNHQNKQQSRQPCIKQVSLGNELQRQRGTRATKSPLSASNHSSAKPSSLRLPSEKIGYFDMKSEMQTVDDHLYHEVDCNNHDSRVRNANTPVQGTGNEPKNRLKDARPIRSPPILVERKANAKNSLRTSSHDVFGIKPADKGHRCRNHHQVAKQTYGPGKEQKENMFQAEDTVIELDLKQHSPIPSQAGAKRCSVSIKPAISLKKSPIAAQKTAWQTTLSPVGTRKKLSTKVSPLKRSAFF